MPQARDEAGNIWEVDAQGNPVRLVRPANQPPADPQYEVNNRTVNTQVQQAEADLRRTQAQTQNAQIDANVAQATAPADIRLRNAQADKAQAEAESIRSGREMTASERANAIRGFTASMSLSQIIADLESRFNEGPGSTSGVLGAADYLPTAANERFNRASNAARGIVGDVLGFTGGQLNSAQEAQMNVGPYIPQASDKDEVIRDSINRLRSLQQQGIQRSVAILGGIPDAAGNIVPVPQDAALDASTVQRVLAAPADERQSVWDQTFVNTSPAQMSAQTGGNTSTPIPPEMQQEYQSFVLGNIQNMTPESYAQFRRQQDQKFGFASNADYEAEGRRIIDGFKQGGTLNLTIPPIEREMTLGETARNAIVDNPFGAGAANFADMVGMGGVSALAGDQMAALREDRPVASTIGQIGGAVAGTGAIGRLGREIAKRAAPKILGGGARGQFARNLATDMTYGAGYGGVTEGDPLSGAAEAGVGSALGQGVGSAIGRAVGGVRSSGTISRLRDLGVTPTIGQIFRARAADRGGSSVVAGIEDLIGNAGPFGSLVNSARTRALEDANVAGYNIGARGQGQITSPGLAGVEELGETSGRSFNNALGEVTIPLNDPRVAASMDAARRRGLGVDTARGTSDFGLTMSRDVDPILANSPTMNGGMLQDAMRALSNRSRTFRKAESSGSQPTAGYVADALDEFGQSITDAAAEYAPGTTDKLREANRIYRNLSILDDAAGRAVNNDGVWTASQLNTALANNTNRFSQSGRGRGLSARSNQDLYQLQQDMARALPNELPPTGINAAPLLALGGAALGGAGYATDNEWLQGAGLAGLSAIPYTKAGQRSLAIALLDRPASAQRLGGAIRRNAGLFGSGAIPLVMSN